MIRVINEIPKGSIYTFCLNKKDKSKNKYF